MASPAKLERRHARPRRMWRCCSTPVAVRMAPPSRQTTPPRRGCADLRREDVARPVIFVGAGTCGLGAGAAKTLAAVQAYLAQHEPGGRRGRGRLHRPVRRRSRWSTCSCPGRTRVSFQHVARGDRSTALLDAVFAGQVPAEHGCGPVPPAAGCTPWDGVPYLDEHPFFAPQTRWVLANCGVIDPRRIEEYIARGGYSALRRMLKQQTPERGVRRWSRRAACAGAAAAASPPARSGSSRCQTDGRPEVPHLQRRRGRPRRVHGPRGDRGRSAPPARRHGHRRLRHRRQQGLRLHPRRVPAGHRAPERGHRPGRGAAACWATTSWTAASTWKS